MSTDPSAPGPDERTEKSAGAGSSDEEIEEFVEEVESDPAESPDDDELKRVKGG